MPEGGAQYRIGDVGTGARVQQGENLAYYEIALHLAPGADVAAALSQGLDASARAGAQRHLATLPVDTVPPPGPLPPGSTGR